MDLIAEQFDFNDYALRRLTKTIKDALDPHGVLSPGKQGIWPSRFRGLRGGHSHVDGQDSAGDPPGLVRGEP
jgi:hypothetical protein